MYQQNSSRRQLIKAGMFGAASLGVSAVVPTILSAQNKSMSNDISDIKILNGALFYEHQAIWAYSLAAGKLTQSEVGKAVLAIALANQADHKMHRDVLSKVITDLKGTPIKAKPDYLATVTPYIQNGDGNLDTDVNIAKLALALEVDAAIAYGQEAAKLKTPAIITAASSIGSTEACHATVIRSAFKSLGVNIKVIPVSFISADTRKDWIIKV
jgi:rubrerythrin